MATENLINAIAQLVQSQQQLMQKSGQQNTNPQNTGTAPPKISVQIPPFKGESKENVTTWLLQAQNVLRTQGITYEATQVNYATTGFKDAALHRRLQQTSTVQEYISQFQNLVGQIEDMGELDQVTYYIDELKPSTKMEVAYQAPDTL
nr:13500_t:CDS:2 [Entrophospora candida]